MHLSVVVVMLVVAGTVYSESCTSRDDCRNHDTTKCEHHTHVFCNTQINQCICTTDSIQSGQTCTMVDSCPNCDNGRHRHCVDGHCVCTRF